MNNSPIDLIVRLKNASLANRKEVELPYSKINKEVAKVLQKEGMLEEVKEEKKGNKKNLIATLKILKRKPVLTGARIISKPSLRQYVSQSRIWEIEKKGKHTVILSTSKGVMTGKEAKKQKIGGEVLLEIW